MSLILEGIDMPKEDEKYTLNIFKNGTAFVAKETWDDSKRGREKLSAEIIGEISVIQIPKDHGRIIDEREAIRGWCKECAFNDGTCGKDETICEDKEMCKYAPTILEEGE